MIVMMRFAFEVITIVAMLALAFVLGRIWEIRQQMIKKRGTRRSQLPADTDGAPYGGTKLLAQREWRECHRKYVGFSTCLTS
jgi:hypothetical protein